MYAEPYADVDEPEEMQYEKILQTIDLINGSMLQIDRAKTGLQGLVDKVKDSYDNTRNKEDKKAILQEIEKIEAETHFNDAISEAVQLHFMLGIRLTEAISNKKRLERKLGIAKCAIPLENIHDINTVIQNSSNQANHPCSSQYPYQRVTNAQFAPSPRTIPPPRVNLPIFSGNEEDFPEFWAIYETLVHENAELSVIEKMLLLKESLQGKSDRSIRGIQLLPQNYDWMIKTLHKKYGNKLANRARIVQQLNELQRATRTAESCELVYDNICMLLNQMSSSGQDIRSSKDALWTEAILNKFPNDIVESVLVKMREYEDVTVDAVMELINGEIAAKVYVQSRLQSNELRRNTSTTYAIKAALNCAICERYGHNTWQCQSTLPVNEKRSIVARKRLCWKCYSSQHSSSQCSRNNCRGRMHHIKLCYASEGGNEHSHAMRNYSKPDTPLTSSELHRDQRNLKSIKKAAESTTSSRYTDPPQRKSHNINIHVERDNDDDDSFGDPEGRNGGDQAHFDAELTENHTNIEANTATPKKRTDSPHDS